MTRQEIEKAIEKNERAQFFIHMADRWTDSDRQALDRLEKEEKELKEMLKNV